MLNPLLLWFLPLAVLPVLLHLLNLHRLREVDLPTFRFLMEGYVQQRRRVRLVEWLLMLLRTAVVLALIWAFSRPVLERFGGLFGGGGRDVVLVVDAGMTSGLVSEGTSAIHRIREAVRSAASRFRPTDFVTLVRAGMEPKVLSRAAVGDGKRLAAEIDTLEPDPGTADLAAGLAEAISGPPRGPRSIWIISDCERRAWRRLAEDPATARIPDSVQLVVVDVGSRGRVTNLAILGDPPRAQRPVVGLPVELTLRIEGAGLDTATETKATVELDDEIVAQVPLVVTPGRVTTSTVAIHPPRPGVLRGRVSLPADAFPEDDSLLFVLNVEPRLGVLVIAPAGVEPIYDPGLFLRAALDSPREAVAATRRTANDTLGNDTPGRSDIAGSLDVVVTRANAFDERQVKAADVIVLADTRFDGGRQRWLRSRVEAGAGLLIAHPQSPEAGGVYQRHRPTRRNHPLPRRTGRRPDRRILQPRARADRLFPSDLRGVPSGARIGPRRHCHQPRIGLRHAPDLSPCGRRHQSPRAAGGPPRRARAARRPDADSRGGAARPRPGDRVGPGRDPRLVEPPGAPGVCPPDAAGRSACPSGAARDGG